MRKNGSREITFAQYRTTDLFLFAVIVGLAELLAFAATVWFPNDAIFSFSFMLPLVLIIMMRWGWPSVFYAIGSGIVYCALHSLTWQYYLTFAVGNAATALLLAYLIPIGKERVAKSWLLTIVMALIAWILMVLVRSAVLALTGITQFTAALLVFCGIGADSGVLSLVMCIIALMIVRRFDGIFEDQKAYLIRVGKMREEKRRVDTFGETLEELDEDSLSVFNNNNDLYT